jgi:hypothetical protein
MEKQQIFTCPMPQYRNIVRCGVTPYQMVQECTLEETYE